MTIPRPLRWLAGGLAALAIGVAILIALFDWNALRGPIERNVTRLTGRSFAINGDLTVRLSMRPLITAHDIVMGNAASSREPVMASARAVSLRIDLLELLTGKLVLPELTLSQPRIALEFSRSGEPNWLFGAQTRDSPAALPAIDRLTIDGGSATFRDPRDGTDMAFEVSSIDGGPAASKFGLALAGKGRYKGQAATLTAQGGALLHLRSAADPYPIKASGAVGSTRFGLDGMLLDPLHFKGEQLAFRIEGSDLALLFPLVGLPMPATPAYRFAGFLDHADHLWSLRRFTGTMGGSDMAGDFSVDRGVKPQKLVANLVSRKLVLRDLAGFVGAQHPARPEPARAGKLLPAGPFNLEKLMAADVDLHFRGDSIVTAKLPLDKMTAHLVVKGGVVTLSPLDFGFAGGNLVSVIEMDARQPRMVTHAAIAAKGLRLARMFPRTKLGAGDTGTIGGRAQLQGSGNSIAQMLGSANGTTALVMDGGSVGELAMRLSNLDIANSLLLMLGGDRQVPVRCMVGIFNAVNGDFKVKSLVLDTAKVNMTGSGHVDFTDESLHLRLVSQSKGFSLASLRGPIAVTGSFANPVLKPELGNAALRGGLAVALGVATAGIGALIPLVDFGHRTDSDCTALVGQARAEAGVKASDLKPIARK